MKDTTDIKLRATYKKLQGVKVSDVDLQLHEEFRNLDQTWLKRLIVLVIMEHADAAREYGQGKAMPVLLGKDTLGSVLLLQDMFAPHITSQSILVTCEPEHLEVAQFLIM